MRLNCGGKLVCNKKNVTIIRLIVVAALRIGYPNVSPVEWTYVSAVAASYPSP